MSEEEIRAAVADMIRESVHEAGTVDWDCVVGRFNASGEDAWVRYEPAEVNGDDGLEFEFDARSASDIYWIVPGASEARIERR